MFDLGFSELVVCFVIALVVLGPTRLPGVVRQIGRWVGKARSMARQFREQLENEINLDELNRMTEQKAKEARAQTPPPPPEFSGDSPAAATTSETAAPATPEEKPPEPGSEAAMAASGYPYGPAEPLPEAPQHHDDTWSHAHGAETTPLPDPDPETTPPGEPRHPA